MERVGVRDLRQNASKWLRRVEEGESFEVTDRGRPVAFLVPRRPVGGTIERMIREGRITPASRPFGSSGPPLKPTPGLPLPSEVLARLREDER